MQSLTSPSTATALSRPPHLAGHCSILLTALPISAMAALQSILHTARVNETPSLPKPNTLLGSYHIFKKTHKSLPWSTKPPWTGFGWLSFFIFPYILLCPPLSINTSLPVVLKHEHIPASGPLHFLPASGPLLFLLHWVLFSLYIWMDSSSLISSKVSHQLPNSQGGLPCPCREVVPPMTFCIFLFLYSHIT